MRITLISGSPANTSHTYALLTYLAVLLEGKNIEVTLWDIRQKQLPIVMPQYHKNPIEAPHDGVKEFIKTIASSDGIILGTPLYHGSYSGVLKSALDCLAKDAFRNKAVGLVSNCGTRSTTALEHLRSVVRTMYGYSLQTHIATAIDDYEEKNNDYILRNDEVKTRCNRFIEELISFTNLLKKA